MLPTWIRAPWTLDTCIPTAVLLQKSNKRIAWHELVMMYGRLDFLVTGGFWWYKDSNSMNAFLGANIQVIVPAATTTSPIIYTLDPPLTAKLQQRRCYIQVERAKLQILPERIHCDQSSLPY